MTSRRRRQPPYARELACRLRGDIRSFFGTSPDGTRPTMLVLIGPAAWDIAATWERDRLLTILPPGEDPAKYDWRALRAADPVLAWECGDIDEAELYGLAWALFRDGVSRMFCVPSGLRFLADE